MLTTLPNLLTLFRIVIIPALVLLFFVPGDLARWLALLLFILAAVSDYFDGYLARRQNQVSAFGKFLDPIADKLLIAAVLLMLVGFDRVSSISVLPALVILCREILVSGLREFLAGMEVPMPVSQLAKWKTTVQMIAIGVLLIGTAAPWGIPAQEIGEAGLWLAAILTLVTGYDYVSRGIRHITSEDTARGGKPGEVR